MIAQRYPEHFIAPMREELTVLGFEELRTPEAVDAAVSRPGTTLMVVNSVCGCAAGKARPGIAMALRHEIKRGGQAYFVHNRVESIASMAALLRRLVPEASAGSR